jgi:hypothetical protein
MEFWITPTSNNRVLRKKEWRKQYVVGIPIQNSAVIQRNNERMEEKGQ